MRGRRGAGGGRALRGGGFAVRVRVPGRKQTQISVEKILGIPPHLQHKRDIQRALNHLQQKDGFHVPNYAQTIAQALDAYYADLVVRKCRTLKQRRVSHNGFKEAFGHLLVPQLTRERLNHWVTEARDDLELADGTIDTRLKHLHAAVAYVQKGQPWALAEFPQIALENVRMVFFEPDEFQAIHRHLAPPFNDIAMVGYLIGWRRGELLDLTWERANRSTGELRLSRSKSGKPRFVIVGPTIREILHRRWREQVVGLPYVFHHRSRHISGDMIDLAWANAVEAAGLTDKKFHDLRRTAARNMVIHQRIDPRVAMDIMGHSTMAMLDRYCIRVTADMERATGLADHAWTALQLAT